MSYVGNPKVPILSKPPISMHHFKSIAFPLELVHISKPGGQANVNRDIMKK